MHIIVLLLLLSCSVISDCDPMDCSTLGFPILHYLPEFAQICIHWVSDATNQLCPLLTLLLPSIFPSIRVFSNELALHIRWPKYLSFSSVLPMKIQGWSPLRLTGLICLLSKGLYTILYKGLEHLWILVSWGVRVLELISCRYQGVTVLWKTLKFPNLSR